MLHFGRKNERQYKGNNSKKDMEQRDLRTCVHGSLKLARWVENKKACGILALINRGKEYKIKVVMLSLV